MFLSLRSLFLLAFLLQGSLGMPVMQGQSSDSSHLELVQEGGHAPETAKLCSDVKNVMADVTWTYQQARHANTSIFKFCDTVRTTIDMCNKVSDVNRYTTTANDVASPLKHFPYIGPVLKVVQPILQAVSVSTKPVKNFCSIYISRLRLENFRDRCNKVEPYMNSIVSRTTLILADVELAQNLWCTCMKDDKKHVGDGRHPAMSTLVQSGCDCIAGKNGCQNQQAKFGKCTNYSKWTCAPDPAIMKWTNADHLGNKYSCIAPTVEKVSKAVNDQIRNLKVAISETINRLKSLLDWINIFKRLNFFIDMPSLKPLLDAFYAVLGPINWLAERIKWILNQKITIQMPGCEQAQTVEQLETLLQAKTGMTLKQAMTPVTKEQLDAAAKKFADSVVYRDIEVVYHEKMAEHVKRFKEITMVQTTSSSGDQKDSQAYRCRDMTDEEMVEESKGKFKSCADKHTCNITEIFQQACPETCGLCPTGDAAKEGDAKGACKVVGQDDPLATVGNNMVGFFPLTGHTDEPRDFCVDGSATVSRGFVKYTCKDGVLSSSTNIFCRDKTENDEETYVECAPCVPASDSTKRRLLGTDDAKALDDAKVLDDTQMKAHTKSRWGHRHHWHHPHRWHVHVPHHHHFHIPHRHHFHIPHHHHIHIPHRHHFHAAAIVKSIGAGIIAVGKAIGELYCYKITFSFMDIIKGLSNLLSWMMKPIDDFIAWLLNGLGIKIPTFNFPWPNIDINIPSFSFDFNIDFLSFNWPQFEWVLKLLSGISIEIPDLIPKCIKG